MRTVVTIATNMIAVYTAQKMKFSIKDLSSKCDQICSFLRIWSHLPEKSLIENFIFCALAFEVLIACGCLINNYCVDR